MAGPTDNLVNIIIGVQDKYSAEMAKVERRLAKLRALSTPAQAAAMNFKKALHELNFRREFEAKLEGVANSTKAAFTPISNIIKDIDKDIRRQQRPFAGYALSIMFFGQALQQMFTSVARFGTKSFNDVMHSVEGTVTQSDYLQASFAYLGFAIGEALEPVLAFLAPIVDAIAEWVFQNPELTAGIVSIGLALGLLLGTGGFLVLAANGFLELRDKIKASGTAADTLRNTIAGLGAGISLAVAFKLADNAYDDFKGGKVAKGIVEAAASASMAGAGIALATGKYAAAGALLTVGVALHLIHEGVFLQSIYSIAGMLAAILQAGVLSALDAIAERFNSSMFSELTGVKMQTTGNSFKENVNKLYENGKWAAEMGDAAMTRFLNNETTKVINYNGVYVTVTAPKGAELEIDELFALAKAEYERSFS